MNEVICIEPAIHPRLRFDLTRAEVIALVSVFILSAAMHWSFFVPAVISDDWSWVYSKLVNGQALFFDLANKRPLVDTLFLAIYQIAGLSPIAYYLVAFLIVVITNAVVYIFARIVLPGSRWLPIWILMVFAFFPSEYTRMWVTMTPHRLTFALTLVSMMALYRFARTAKMLAFWVFLPLFTIPLLEYELQMGLAITWGLVLFASNPRLQLNKRLLLLTPLLISGFYFLLRLAFPGSPADHYMDAVTFNPLVLIERLVFGFISLAWGGLANISTSIHQPDPIRSMGLFLLSIFVFCLIAIASGRFNQKPVALRGPLKNDTPSRPPRTRGGAETDISPRAGELKGGKLPNKGIHNSNSQSIQPEVNLWKYLAISILLTIAGYFPVILLFSPGLDLLASRVNMIAILGASASVVLAFAIVLHRFAGSRNQLAVMTFAACIPFVVVGLASELVNRYYIRDYWNRQSAMWREITTIAPDIKQDTLVVFYMENRVSFLGAINRPVVNGGWETDGALNLLYHPGLSSEIKFSDSQKSWDTRFLQSGVQRWGYGEVIPYKHVVILRVDATTGATRVVDDPGELPGFTWGVSDYDPYSLILPDPP